MIPRNLLNDLVKHLESPEISLITGPRQVGKTTLMTQLQTLLSQQNKPSLFLNLDIESDKRFTASQDQLLYRVKSAIGDSGYVFLDEIQRKENAGIFLKGLYDVHLPYKFIVSGSGSLELKEKIHESLAGRKRVFELNPVSFFEFTNFQLKSLFIQDPVKTALSLNEYLNFGGYPKVILASPTVEKIKFMDEIFQSYLEKDISFLLGIKKTDAFTNLVKLIAAQIGQPVNLTEISSTLGVSTKTVSNYLWFLEKTFILRKNTPFHHNLRKELTKSPAYYFVDLGLRNQALGRMGNITTPNESGFLFQNLVHNLLHDQLRYSAATLHFWRTKDGAEVDFVLNRGEEHVPIEVKYQTLTAPQLSRSFRSFLSKYHPPRAYVINLNLKSDLRVENTNVHFLPYFELSSLNLLN